MNKIEKSFNPKARDRVEFVEYVSLQKNLTYTPLDFSFLDETFLKNETILKAGRILEKWENFFEMEDFC